MSKARQQPPFIFSEFVEKAKRVPHFAQTGCLADNLIYYCSRMRIYANADVINPDAFNCSDEILFLESGMFGVILLV